MPLQLGQRIGRYEVAAIIGKGAQAEVYLVRDHQTNGKFAAKVWPQDRVGDAWRAFQRELARLKEINDDHVVRLYDFFPLPSDEGGIELVDADGEGGIYCVLVMEYAPRQSASANRAEFLRDHRTTANLFRQVVRGLTAIHKTGNLHRDMKPDNILVFSKGDLIILGVSDLGLASHAGYHETLAGTLPYMSPEAIKALDGSVELTTKSDVYSLGATFFNLLTERLPFDPEHEKAFMDEPIDDLLGYYRTLHETNRIVPRPSLYCREPGPRLAVLSERLDELVQAMMSKAPDDRPSLSEVGEALEEIVIGMHRPITDKYRATPRCSLVWNLALHERFREQLGYFFIDCRRPFAEGQDIIFKAAAHVVGSRFCFYGLFGRWHFLIRTWATGDRLDELYDRLLTRLGHLEGAVNDLRSHPQHCFLWSQGDDKPDLEVDAELDAWLRRQHEQALPSMALWNKYLAKRYATGLLEEPRYRSTKCYTTVMFDMLKPPAAERILSTVRRGLEKVPQPSSRRFGVYVGTGYYGSGAIIRHSSQQSMWHAIDVPEALLEEFSWTVPSIETFTVAATYHEDTCGQFVRIPPRSRGTEEWIEKTVYAGNSDLEARQFAMGVDFVSEVLGSSASEIADFRESLLADDKERVHKAFSLLAAPVVTYICEGLAHLVACDKAREDVVDALEYVQGLPRLADQLSNLGNTWRQTVAQEVQDANPRFPTSVDEVANAVIACGERKLTLQEWANVFNNLDVLCRVSAQIAK